MASCGKLGLYYYDLCFMTMLVVSRYISADDASVCAMDVPRLVYDLMIPT